jgi:hypothetical protein
MSAFQTETSRWVCLVSAMAWTSAFASGSSKRVAWVWEKTSVLD